ncbi:hypothetical protein [Nocardia rhamnosiphila]|uniref:Uncharacterized protein n=1 Tax=Nocardia rhamnosiphila TaxID=426716 RepID=A0ABV2X2L0_9NOCA
MVAPTDAGTRTEKVCVTSQVTWTLDWSSFVDEIDYHDPEVAIADGFADVVLPSAGLSILAVAPDVAELVLSTRYERVWTSTRPVVAGEPLETRITIEGTTAEAQFCDRLGVPVVTERFTHASAENCAVDPDRSVFRTQPFDLTRQRAMAWGLALLGGHAAWAEQSDHVTAAALTYVLPSLIGARSIITGPGAARQIRSVTCLPLGKVQLEDRLSAVEAGDNTVAVCSGDRPIARVAVHF